MQITRDSHEIIEQQIVQEGQEMEEAYNRLKAKEELEIEGILQNKEEFEWVMSE